jgi:cytochrome c-type biogenesis protein
VADVPFALAVAAGMLAAVNPCGFALLPAYLSLLVVGDRPQSRRVAVGRALVLTAAMTAGFAAVFGVFGLVVAPVAGTLQRYLPWFTVGLGLVLVLAGGWLLAGRALPSVTLRRRARSGRDGGPAVTRSAFSMVAFGASYAVASIGCTIGPFLAIVVASFRSGSVAAGVALFVAYALGMGLAVGTAAVLVALARTRGVRSMRRVGGVVDRLAGAVLVVVGAYVAYYGWYEIRVFANATTEDPVVAVGEELQRLTAGMLDRVGAPAVAAALGVLLLALVAVPAVYRQVARDQRPAGDRRGDSIGDPGGDPGGSRAGSHGREPSGDHSGDHSVDHSVDHSGGQASSSPS